MHGLFRNTSRRVTLHSPTSSGSILGTALSRPGSALAQRTALLLFALSLTAAHAQNTCSLPGIKHNATLAYPPIANHAHVTGDVALLLRFGTNGNVESVQVLSGNQMFRKAAVEWVKSWQTYESPQEQSCPVEIAFRFEGEATCDFDPSSRVSMTDLRRFKVATTPTMLCDPSGTITSWVNHRFLFWHWHSRPIVHTNE